MASRFNPKAWELFALIVPAFLFLAAVSFTETAQAFSYAYESFKAGAALSVIHKILIVMAGTAAMMLAFRALGMSSCWPTSPHFLAPTVNPFIPTTM